MPPSSKVVQLKHFTPSKYFQAIDKGTVLANDHVQVVQLGPMKEDLVKELVSQRKRVEGQRVVCGPAQFRDDSTEQSNRKQTTTDIDEIQCGPTRHVRRNDQSTHSAGILLSRNELSRTRCACVLPECLEGGSCVSSLVMLSYLTPRLEAREKLRMKWTSGYLGASAGVRQWIDLTKADRQKDIQNDEYDSYVNQVLPHKLREGEVRKSVGQNRELNWPWAQRKTG